MSRGPAARVGIVLGALALLLAMGAWLGREHPAEAQGPAQPASRASGFAATGASPASAANPWALLAAAERAASGAPSDTVPALPKAKAHMSEADWQAFDQQWCAAMAPLRQAIQGGASVDEFLLAAWMPPEVEMRAIDEQLAQRVGRALAARADPRERAVGLWWDGKAAELLAMAQATRDPMVAALAAQRNRSPEALRLWRTLEPRNAVALLMAQPLLKLPEDEFLDQLILTRESNTWMRAAFQVVYSVPLPRSGAYTEMALQAQAVGRHAAASWGDTHALVKACPATADAARAQRCAQAAEALWGSPPADAAPAMTALQVVRKQPALRAVWAERASLLEAHLRRERELTGDSVAPVAERMACLPSPAWDALTRARLLECDWGFVQARMPADPASVAALAAAYRANNGGRSLLDPRPPAATQP